MSVVWFITLLGVLIAVHEAGHLVAARLLGIGVVKFSVGFGPPDRQLVPALRLVRHACPPSMSGSMPGCGSRGST